MPDRFQNYIRNTGKVNVRAYLAENNSLQSFRNHRFSKAVLLFCFVLIFVGGFLYYPKWKQPATEATISWDVSGYYFYLPALVIYKDIKKLAFTDSILTLYRPTPDYQQAFLHPSGNYVIKYSAGQALLFSPFFFIGHLIAIVSDRLPPDGFSFPYQFSLATGMLLYSLLGLWVLRKFLLAFFSDKAVGISIFCVAIGSNYFNYASIDSGMTHNTLFTVYSLLLYFTHRYHQKPVLKNALCIGSLIGLATLVRPTEIISVLIPLLWSMGLPLKIQFRRTFPHVAAASMAAVFFIFIQLLYWKSVTGNWFVYSYGDEGFNWRVPHFWKSVFSYRSGWLTYSPVLLFSLVGFFFLYRYSKKLFLLSFLFFTVFSYLCFSWATWWYGGSLGQRAMIQCYPILSIPMAAFFQWLSSRTTHLKLMGAFFVFLFAIYNLWWTHQAHLGGLFRTGEMTKEYFWAVLGRTNVKQQVISLLDNPVLHRNIPPGHHLLYRNGFENDSLSIPGISGKSIWLDRDQQFSPEYVLPLPPAGHTKLRAVATFRFEEKEWVTWKMTQFIIKMYRQNSLVTHYFVRPHRQMENNQTKKVLLDAILPNEKVDKMTILFWNAEGEKEILIDDLEVVSF